MFYFILFYIFSSGLINSEKKLKFHLVDKSIWANPFSIAVMNGHHLCVRTLIENGHDVDSVFTFPSNHGKNTSQNMTPLLLACQYGNIEVMKLLFSLNANCSVFDSTYANVLHVLAKSGDKNGDILPLIKIYLYDNVMVNCLYYQFY